MAFGCTDGLEMVLQLMEELWGLLKLWDLLNTVSVRMEELWHSLEHVGLLVLEVGLLVLWNCC